MWETETRPSQSASVVSRPGPISSTTTLLTANRPVSNIFMKLDLDLLILMNSFQDRLREKKNRPSFLHSRSLVYLSAKQ